MAGLAAGIILHKGLVDDAALSGLAAGMALLPDMDQQSGTASHCLGFLSRLVARVISAASGGHRKLTHSITGVAFFCAVAWAGVTFRHDWAGWIVLGVMITIAASSALEAFGVNGHLADVLGLGAAVAVVLARDDLGLVLAATVAGVLSHLALDAATDRGIPVLLPLSRWTLHLLPEPLAWTTGTRPEKLFVFPALVVLLAGESILAIHPAAWHAVVGAL